MNLNRRLTLSLVLHATSLGAGIWGVLPSQLVEAKAPLRPLVDPAIQAADVAELMDMSRKEVQRREASRATAIEQLRLAQAKMSIRDYQAAIKHYLEALKNLPESRNNQSERAHAMTGFRDASLELAKIRASEGRYFHKEGQQLESAEDVLNALLEKDPDNRAARRQLERLYDPTITNRMYTPTHRAELEDVKRLLTEAQGFYDIGKFDLAIKRADQVLDIDPYNSAARKIQQMADDAVTRYGETAYDEARARAIRNVQKAWASPVKRYGTVSTSTTAPQQMEESGVERLRKKVATLVIPEVEFRDSTLTEVAAILTELSKNADRSNDPQKGVTILVNIPNLPKGGAAAPAAPGGSVLDLPPPTSGGGGINAMPTVTLPKIPNFTLARILDYVTEQSGTTKWTVKKDSIEIVPKTAQTDTLILRTWTVSPFIFSSSAPKVDAELSSTGLGGLGLAGASSGGAAPKPNNARRIDAKEFLSGQNVSFAAPNSTATYNPRTKSLTVFNTAEMLDIVDQLVADGADSSPVQVDIQARFVEFTQQNLKELSFDWLMGQSNVQGSERIFTGGGTTGSQRPSLNSSDFPFTIPPGGAFPNGGNPVGVFPVTGGNRSGKLALSSSAIDALLAGATGGGGLAGPAAFSVAGAFTDPQFQMVIRAMNQSKAIDLLSSPSIVARNQEEANIDIVREFMYPTAFTPPQIGGAAGGAGAAAGGAAAANNGAATASIPVTPTTPSDFLKRDTGVKLKVNPTIQPDRYSVDLDLRPEVIEFEGFINYGSPIQTVATQSAISTAVGGIASTPKAITLTDNVINQPIFAVRRIQTTVTLLDGETIALGGLIREDVQKVDDKVPILGDIPGLGRLFRSKVDQHIKKNLTIFVTARIIDAAGQPIKINKAEQEPPEEVPALTAPR
jgi:general secretion pathway protein D